MPNRFYDVTVSDPGALFQQLVTGEKETRRECYDACRNWTAAYERIGLNEGETVAALLKNSLQVVHAWLGCAGRRAIFSPGNTMYVGDMLSYYLNDTQARVMLVSETFLPRLLEVENSLEFLQTVVIVDASVPSSPASVLRLMDLNTFLGDIEPVDRLPRLENHDIACMVYTSGTTGPSKGVLVSWRHIREFALGNVPYLSDRSGAFYCFAPMFHISGLIAFLVGVEYEIPVIIREKFSVTNFWKDVKEHNCHVCVLFASMAIQLLRSTDPCDNPLRQISLGPLISELDEFKQAFGVDVLTCYGMTEIGVVTFVPTSEAPNMETSGKVRPGYELRVVDEYDNPVGPNTVGELIVRTHEPWMLNAGYWNRPEATATAWRNGWFHTGDGFKHDDDGYFYFIDRLKDTLRRRGENISAFEVEALVQKYPDVSEVAAIAVPSDMGEDDLKIVVVPKAGRRPAEIALFDYLVTVMPKFMLPRYIEFVDDLPRTPNAKVRKSILREHAVNSTTWDREA